MNKLLLIALIAAPVATALPGCSTAPTTTEEKTSLASEAQAALDRFLASDPTLKAMMDSATGYAVLPDVGKGGMVVGGSFGRGEVFEKGAKVGYVQLAEGTIGFQLGAQTFSELIVFKTQGALDDCKDGNFSFAANATAVAIKPGAAATFDSASSVAVFTHIKGGLMAEAAIGGQKLTYKPL